VVARKRHLDIDGIDELIRAAELVQADRQPVSLYRAGQEIAEISPAGESILDSEHAADRKSALVGLAGAWADLDTDAMVEEIYQRRTQSIRRYE
jgi:hypothetical protein